MRHLICVVLLFIFSILPSLAKTPMTSEGLNQLQQVIDVQPNPQGSYIAFIRKKPRALLKDPDAGQTHLNLFLN